MERKVSRRIMVGKRKFLFVINLKSNNGKLAFLSIIINAAIDIADVVKSPATRYPEFPLLLSTKDIPAKNAIIAVARVRIPFMSIVMSFEGSLLLPGLYLCSIDSEFLTCTNLSINNQS